jgi:hypothetical protein
MSAVGHLRSAREGALRKSKNLHDQVVQDPVVEDQVVKDQVVEDHEIEFCCCLLGGRTGDQARGLRLRACFFGLGFFPLLRHAAGVGSVGFPFREKQRPKCNKILGLSHPAVEARTLN